MPITASQKSAIQAAVAAVESQVSALEVDPTENPLQAQLDAVTAERDALAGKLATVKAKLQEQVAIDATEDANRATILNLLGN
jgi:small-conductance mechanosensitive channel